MLILLGACASTVPPHGSGTRSTSASDAVLDEWVERHERRAIASQHVRARPETQPRSASTRQVVREGRRIHVAFRRAPLTEALRLLAQEARVQLVIADALSGEVNLRMRNVRPWDAMLALAEAHGADVLRDGDLVIVRAR